MNNNAELIVNGDVIGLTFGMIASEEFVRAQLERGYTEESAKSANNLLMICDAMYAGACNYAMLKRKPNPDYETFVNAIDDLYSSDEGVVQLNKACGVWQESKFGKSLGIINENIKKKLDELNQRPSTGQQSDNLHIVD